MNDENGERQPLQEKKGDWFAAHPIVSIVTYTITV